MNRPGRVLRAGSGGPFGPGPWRARGSRVPEPTQRAILMLKRSHEDSGIDRIHDVLLRGEGFAASPGAIKRVLLEAGYEIESIPTAPHAEPRTKSFERAKPNQLWQSDLFTFVLKRELTGASIRANTQDSPPVCPDDGTITP